MEKITEFINFCVENESYFTIGYTNPYDKQTNLKDILELAQLVYNDKNKEKILEELKLIKKIIENISDSKYSYGNYYEGFLGQGNKYNKFLEDYEFIKKYKGFWNVEYFLQKYRLNMEYLEEYKENLRKKYKPSFAEVAERQQQVMTTEKEKIKKFKEDYEFKENILPEIDLKKYEALEKDGEEININNIHYPVIVKFFKNNKVISINKCTTNLYNMLATKKNLEFDRFNVVHVNENIIDDMVIEYKIKYDPIHNSTAIIQNMKKVYKYRHENQVRNYYKDRYNMTAIKKIVRLYEVSTFTFYSGAKIYNRAELEEAIEKHLQKN